MRSSFALGIGAAIGFFLVRERHVRRASERVAAAALETLLNAIDANDGQTGRHVRRVANYALILGDAAGLPLTQLRTVERVALFHDVGKIHEALFDLIREPHELTPEEKRAVATHPIRGADVLAPLTPFYPELADGVLSHHERWDGSGYPRGLRGEAIPMAARIVSLADTFDAITHNRRYRDGRSTKEAAEVIAAGRGTQFDPRLVDLMLEPQVFAKIVAAQREALTPKASHGNRRHGREESHVPDLTFRWRPESPASRAPDPPPQRSR